MSEVHNLTAHYNHLMLNVLDLVAQLQLKRMSSKLSKPWFNESLNSERRNLRLTERLWRSYPSPEHLYPLRSLRSIYNNRIRCSKTTFFRTQLDQAKNHPKKQFELIKSQANSHPTLSSPGQGSLPNYEEFADFFTDKAIKIETELRSALDHLSISPLKTLHFPGLDFTGPAQPYLPKNNASWSLFQTLDEGTIRKMLSTLKPSNHYNNPLPSNLFLEVRSSLLTLWTTIVNASLRQGAIPDCLKSGQVTPILKKPSADPTTFITVTQSLTSPPWQSSWRNVCSPNSVTTLNIFNS